MNDLPPVIRMAKSTGTHADVLAAVGLADLLSSLPGAGSVRLRERDGGFELGVDLNDVKADLIPQVPGYPFLKTNEKVRVPPKVTDVVDYKVEKAKADRNKQVRASQGRGPRNVDSETQQLMQREQVREDWRLLQVLNTLQGDGVANKVHDTIVNREPGKFLKEVTAGLEALSHQRPSGIKWPVGTVQIFTPTAAKGYRRLKPDSTSRENDKLTDHWTDPLVEWFKYRGYFRVACPFFQGPKGEHVRLLCPIPHDVSVRAIESVARELRKAGVYGGPPKMDALAALTLAELLVRHSEEYHDPGAEIFPGLSLRGKTPAEAISGIMVTHYQSLGNAKAVGAMSTIALPGWFRIENREDANVWLGILDEHKRVLRGLQDNHSDEIGLLVWYRRFLEKRGDISVWALIEFMELYGVFVMRANGSKVSGRIRWTPRFTDEHLRRILMGADSHLLEIMNDAGFEAVSCAVRQATVTSQNRRARQQEVWREIRYDLLHDIHRTRKVPGDAFVECISQFISRYNYENARRREVKKDPMAAPANVGDEELKSFIALIGHHGAAVVGALLAAYGTCKERWEPEQGDSPDSAASPQT
jgi:hypothetical protein